MSQKDSVRVDVILYCDIPEYDLYYAPKATETCGYDMVDKPEEPEYTLNLRYESDQPIVDTQRSPRFVRVLLKRLMAISI